MKVRTTLKKRTSNVAHCKHLNPIRLSMSLFSSWQCSSISQSRQLIGGWFEPVKILLKRFEASITQYQGSEFKYKFISTLTTFHSLNSTGTRSTIVGIAGASFVIGGSPAVVHAIHGEDILVDNRDSFDASDRDEFAHAAWIVIRKLWLPFFFILTLVSNSYNPVLLFTKAVLLLLATRPSPLRVYLFVDQVSMRAFRFSHYCCVFFQMLS